MADNTFLDNTSDWSIASNWSLGTVPTGTDTAIITSTSAECKLSENLSEATLTIEIESGGVFSEERFNVSVGSILVENSGTYKRWDGTLTTNSGMAIQPTGILQMPDIIIFPVIPTGIVSEEQLFIDNLKFLIASTTTFQDLVGATGTTQEKIDFAMLRVYTSTVPSTEAVVPYAQIGHNEGLTKGDVAFTVSVANMWIVFANTVGNIDDQDELDSFREDIGKVGYEIEHLEGHDSYLTISSLATSSEFEFSEPNQFNEVEAYITYNLITGA